MNRFLCYSRLRRVLALACLGAASAALPAHAQEANPAPSTAAEPKPEIAASKDFPAQIELLETRFRFEKNGDSRKEIHALVKINSELGARQFARLNFDYNRGFQQVDIPFVRITHASGGTVDMLPRAVTDAPNPAVADFPAYHDARVKSARILGLQPGDKLEYRVVTTTTRHPLAPDFWLDHSFDRTGVVSQEIFELDLPGDLTSTARMNTVRNGPLPVIFVNLPWTSMQHSGEGDSARSEYRWEIATTGKLPPAVDDDDMPSPDVIVSSFGHWNDLVRRLAPQFLNGTTEDLKEIQNRLKELAPDAKTQDKILRASYEFVSQRLRTVDLPIGATGYRIRPAKDILASGYATAEEKCFLMAKFASLVGSTAEILFTGAPEMRKQFPRPTILDRIFVVISEKRKRLALDPSVEVAPFGVIPSQFRGKPAFTLTPFGDGDVTYDPWITLPADLPFPSSQRVAVDAALAGDGKLTAKVKYVMRGDNELLLRVAFHQSPKERWKEVAQLLALSDGFRGQITSVTASDPYATNEPFSVAYEIAWPKFVDWSKKPARIPVLLPQISLPDPPAKPAAGTPAQNIELGTPLDVETQVTLHLPAGATASAPPGTSVARDYASFSSKYSAQGGAIAASRRINFLLRELPAARAADYNAFFHAVQSDQFQFFTAVLPGNTPPAAPKPK